MAAERPPGEGPSQANEAAVAFLQVTGVLVDTGILYALADRRDAWHRRAVAWFDQPGEIRLVPVTVLPEAAYLIRDRLGAQVEQRFVDSLVDATLTIESLSPRDVKATGRVMREYPELGFVDASVVSIAERLKIGRIATTDRRHFSTVRPAHRKSFELVP